MKSGSSPKHNRKKKGSVYIDAQGRKRFESTVMMGGSVESSVKFAVR